MGWAHPGPQGEEADLTGTSGHCVPCPSSDTCVGTGSPMESQDGGHSLDCRNLCHPLPWALYHHCCSLSCLCFDIPQNFPCLSFFVEPGQPTNVFFQTLQFITPYPMSLHPLASLSTSRVIYVALCLVHCDPWIVSSLSLWSAGILNLLLASLASSFSGGHCDALTHCCSPSGLWQAALPPARSHKIKTGKTLLINFICLSLNPFKQMPL